MDAAIITAVAAVSGSIVGGLASFATTFFTQRNQAHRDFLSRDVAHREELYSQFIKEATNLYADSLDKTLTNPATLTVARKIGKRAFQVLNALETQTTAQARTAA